MVELNFDEFEWDKGNDTKSLAKHGIAKEAIEAFFQSDPSIADDPRHSELEDRCLAIGTDKDGRWMIVSFTLRIQAGVRKLRPISARFMHSKEVKRYEKAIQAQD